MKTQNSNEKSRNTFYSLRESYEYLFSLVFLHFIIFLALSFFWGLEWSRIKSFNDFWGFKVPLPIVIIFAISLSFSSSLVQFFKIDHLVKKCAEKISFDTKELKAEIAYLLSIIERNKRKI